MRITKTYINALILIAGVVLSLSNVNAQTDQEVISRLKEKFSNYVRSFPREEVFIHTDREEYIAGEEVFFTGYVLDRQTIKASPFSRIVYVELLNASSVPVLQKKFMVSSGICPGNLDLPDTLSTGMYRMIAYTNWMKNFLPANCFTKQIRIFNLLKDEGIEQRQIKSAHAPDNNMLYANSGISFKVDRSVNDSIRLNVSFDNETSAKSLHVIIQTRGNLIFTNTYHPAGNTVISIASAVLQPGINQITLFSDEGKPVSEKLIYWPAQVSTTNIICNDTFGIRDKINIKLSGEGMRSPFGRFSISVAPGMVSGINLREYMLTGTEFGINFTEISGGSDLQNLSVNRADSILSGLTSNWINWRLIAESNSSEPEFAMETEYHYLTGTLKTEENLSDSSMFVFLCSPGRNAFFRYALCDNTGRFSFAVGLENELEDFVFIPDKVKGKTEVVIDSPYLLHEEALISSAVDTSFIPEYIPKWSINYQVNKLYLTPYTKNIQPGNSKGNIRFYGKPDIELVMDDYISLPLMEEVFFEILPNVSVRTRDSKREIIIIDRVDNMPWQSIPCLMIDGVIIKDADLILNLDPEIVEKVDVIREKYIFGKYVFPGIVNVITRKADFSAIELPAYMKRMAYSISDSIKTFALPDTHLNPRLPDYRNILYWNPLLTFDDSRSLQVSFSSSDNAADYTITVQGITGEGNLVSERRAIRVLF